MFFILNLCRVAYFIHYILFRSTKVNVNQFNFNARTSFNLNRINRKQQNQITKKYYFHAQ